MKQSCHRCGTGLSPEDTFCPNCGAPQLNFDADSQDLSASSSDPEAFSGRPGQVNWKDAIGAAILVAVPAGLLSGLPVLEAGSLLWKMGGAAIVILLYKRKRPKAWLTGRSGFRIGSLTGLATAYVSVVVAAILHVIQRYPMHAGEAIDRDYDMLMQQLIAATPTSSVTQAQVRAYFQFFLTPDGRAAYSFMGIVSLVIVSILYAALGGYVGVRLFAGRRLA